MRKPIRILFLSVCIYVFIAAVAYAQELPFQRFPRALGVQVGRVAGIGLSYQHWDGSWGYQVVAGGLYHPLTGDGQDLYVYNAGIEGLYSLFEDDFASWLSGRVYLFAGINHRGYQETASDDFNPEFAFGSGVGVEALLFEHFSIATEMAYVLLWMPIQGQPHQQFALEMLPQVSLRYRF